MAVLRSARSEARSARAEAYGLRQRVVTLEEEVVTLRRERDEAIARAEAAESASARSEGAMA